MPNKKIIEPVYKKLGKKLRAIRKSAGMTQLEIGTRLGLTRGMINNMEHGRQRIYMHHLESLAKSYGIKPKSLLKGIWL